MTKKYVNLMPDWSNTDLWRQLTGQMLTGHNKHIRKTINHFDRVLLKKQFFTEIKAYSEDQIEFYKSLQEISAVCLQEIEKKEKGKNQE
jgi:hypothetical protein